MNPKRLLQHFNEIAEAPDAVPRLRRFILDLAVRGKLVEQDPKDEPASELLKRIEAVRTRAGMTKGLRNMDLPSPTEAHNARFEIPKTWDWVHIEDIAYVEMGQSPSSEFYNRHHEGLPFYQGKADFGRIHPTPRYWCTAPTKLAEKGDILISVRAPVGPTNVAIETCCIGRGLAGLRPYKGYERDFLLLCLQKFEPDLEALGSGTTFVAINRKHLVTFLVPLPPLAEQHRIVAKVEELMTLYDELDAAQQKRERRRDRLVAATLNGIGRDGSPSRPNIPQLKNTGAFGESALPGETTLPNHDIALPKFFLNHLPRLTTRPEHIQQLRQTILNLAVYGKLVPQDPNEEPATDLLRKIPAERLQLLQDKQMPVQKLVKPSSHLDDESRIPDSWQNCYLQDIAYQITDGTHLTPKYTDWGKPFLSAQNVKPFRFMPENHRYVSESDFEKYRANRKPERGDVLLTRVGAGIGESTVLDSDLEFAFYVSLCLIKIPAKLFLSHFLVIWLNSPIGRSNSTTRTYGKGFSQGNLNLGMIRTFRVPLPPLAEQHRIVVRVDEMMAVCDELEARLSTTTNIRGQLLEASLSEALAIR